MSTHRRFDYHSTADLQTDLTAFNLELPVSGSLSSLAEPVAIGTGTAANRIAVQPMEGCDGTDDGSPGPLTLRRYQRFASGGSGLLWVEANAVVAEGRANPHQLWLHSDNVVRFTELVELIKREAPREPYTVLQLTHSGRYSRPVDRPRPQVAVDNPYLDKPGQQNELLSDHTLAALVPAYVKAAKLAWEAGFNAVDVKACHRYLLNELLSARTRPGRYGGTLENRSRLLLDIVQAIKAEVPIDVAVRLNAYDEIPYPFGWGVSESDHRVQDLSETRWLAVRLKEAGVSMINVTGGNPYYNPHVNRPYDSGPYQPPQHQLFHAVKLLQACRSLRSVLLENDEKSGQEKHPVRLLASGVSWLRHLAAPVSAALVQHGWCDLVGFGRQAFAYPDFASDLLAGEMDEKKCCIACGKCSEIMRDGGSAGCVIRDSAVYLPIYQAGRAGKAPLTSKASGEHV